MFFCPSMGCWWADAEPTGCGFLLRSDGDQGAPSQYLLGLSRFGGGRVYFSVMAEGETVSEQDCNPSNADASFSIADGATNRLEVVARGYRFQVYTNGSFLA